jgi:hypothetical protein
VKKSDGTAVSRINPFGTSIDKNKFVAGPLTADAQGDVYYNVIKLDPTNPWLGDVLGSWLVKVSADDTASTVTFKKLTKGAPKGTDKLSVVLLHGEDSSLASEQARQAHRHTLRDATAGHQHSASDRTGRNRLHGQPWTL